MPPHPLAADLKRHARSLRETARRNGQPNLTRVTIILRDPDDDAASVVYTDERDVSDACRVALEGTNYR
jgi:hypothetical protein